MATTAFDTVGVRPEHDVSKETDVEKRVDDSHAHGLETNSNGSYKADNDSDRFQPGVQRVRAITEIWSKSTLISMFVLYDY